MSSAEIHTDNPTLREFAEDAARTLGPSLLSILEYRPMAVATDGKPRIHLLVLCRSIGPEVTAALRVPLKRASRSIELVPILFSKDDFLASLDVFPVEASEIRSTYKVVFGEDLMREAEVTTVHLRHQIEFELRSKKLFLLSQLLRNEEDSTEVGRTVLSFYGAFMGLARYYFLLIGKELVTDDRTLIRELAADPGISEQTLVKLGDAAAGRVKVGPGEKAQLVWSFLAAVDKLTVAIDRLGTK